MPIPQRIPKTSTRRQPSWETRAMVEHLCQQPIGSMVSYAELMLLAGGKDIQHRRRDLLDTARDLLRREYRMVYDTVTNVGIQRLDDIGIVKRTESGRTALEKKSRRELHTLQCADMSQLDAAMQYQAMAYAGLFLAVGAMVAHETVKLIQQTGQVPPLQLPSAEELRQMFKGA